MNRRELLQLGALASGSMLTKCTKLKPSKPNVVLLVADTLRADHVGCYGCTRPLTPYIDAFSERATRYPYAWMTASWTLSSHASMFTGLFPFEHFAHYYNPKIKDSYESNGRNELPLDDRFISLAEVFRREGYKTGAISANTGYVNHEFGLNQGFDYFDVRYDFAPDTNERVKRWLSLIADKPFFLFVNYMDAHGPCNTAPCHRVIAEPIERPRRLYLDLYQTINKSGGYAPEDRLALYKKHYDLGTCNVDKGIGWLLSHLKRLNLYDNSIIVFTSDHGEMLGEHNLFAHGMDISEELVRVPLIVKALGQKRAAVDETPVCAVDIPQLIFDRLRGKLGSRCFECFPHLPRQHPIIVEQYYALVSALRDFGSRFWRVRRAVYETPYKFISCSSGQNALFNLDRDPLEQNNLIGSMPNLSATLAQRLKTFLAKGPSNPETPPEYIKEFKLDEEAAQQLKALGYF